MIKYLAQLKIRHCYINGFSFLSVIKDKLLLTLLVCLSCNYIYTQIGIGTTTPNAYSILDIASTNKGFLLTRLNNDLQDAITNPATGLLIYNTNDKTLTFNRGTPALPDWIGIIAFNKPLAKKQGNTRLGPAALRQNLNPNSVLATINLPIVSNEFFNYDGTLFTTNTEAKTITINQSGRYRIIVNVSLLHFAVRVLDHDHIAPEMWISINRGGTEIPPTSTYASTGYLVNFDDDELSLSRTNSSLHITEVVNLNANDILSFKIRRSAGISGVVLRRAAGSSNIYIEKIR